MIERRSRGLAGSLARERTGPQTATRYRATIALAAITCATLPLYTLRWHYGPLPTTLLETAILVTIAAFVIETWITGSLPLGGRVGEGVKWRTAFTVPAIVLLVAGALDVAFAPDHRAALGLYRAYFIEPIAFFIVLVSAITAVRQALLVLAGLGVGGIVLAIPNAIVVLHAIGSHTLNLAGTPPVALYQTQNAVALFLLPLIAVAASLLLYGRTPERLGSAAFLLIAVPTFLLTLSRGGYIAFATVLLALAITHRLRVWFVLAGAIAIVLFTRIPAIAIRLEHDLNFADPTNTLVGRVPLWRATLQMLAHHPVFGAGLSGFETQIAPYWNATHIDRFIYPHNIMLNFWVATGLLGVFAFGWLLVVAFRQTIHGWRSGPADWRPLQLGVCLALIAMVVHGLVDVPYFKNDLSMEFWVLLALSTAGTLLGFGERHPADA